ncbi:hypothetical protein D3C86_1658400 [compost metagenome]
MQPGILFLRGHRLSKQFNRPTARRKINFGADNPLHYTGHRIKALQLAEMAPGRFDKIPGFMHLTNNIKIAALHLNPQGHCSCQPRMIFCQQLHDAQLPQ